MYDELEVTNFRGLDDFSLRDLAPVVLISGQNSTGKSAVLEALFLNACGPLAAQHGVTTLRAFRGDGGLSLSSNSDTSPWDSLYSNFDTESPIEITAKHDLQWDTVALVANGQRTQAAGVLVPGQPGTQTLTSSIQVRVRAGRSKRIEDYTQTLVATIEQGGGTVNNFNLNLSISPPTAQPLVNAHLKGARTRANPQELADRFSNLKMRGREGELTAILKSIEPRLRRVEILTEQGQGALFLDLGRKVPLPLTVLGEGIAAIVDFVTSIHIAGGGVVLIDEIENGIHYSVLPDLWRVVHRAAERSNVQIVATTHSHECVEAAYTALAKRPDRLKLLRMRRKDDKVSATPYDAETLGGALAGNLEVR